MSKYLNAQTAILSIITFKEILQDKKIFLLKLNQKLMYYLEKLQRILFEQYFSFYQR